MNDKQTGWLIISLAVIACFVGLLLASGDSSPAKPMTENQAKAETAERVQLTKQFDTGFSAIDLTQYTNDLRIAEHKSTLLQSSELETSAQYKCDDMQANNYWAHDNPNGDYSWTYWFTKANVRGIHYGENLYRKAGANQTMLAVYKAWLYSPAHRAIMVSGKYDHVGFAECYGQQGRIIVAHFSGF